MSWIEEIEDLKKEVGILNHSLSCLEGRVKSYLNKNESLEEIPSVIIDGYTYKKGDKIWWLCSNDIPRMETIIDIYVNIDNTFSCKSSFEEGLTAITVFDSRTWPISVIKPANLLAWGASEHSALYETFIKLFPNGSEINYSNVERYMSKYIYTGTNPMTWLRSHAPQEVVRLIDEVVEEKPQYKQTHHHIFEDYPFIGWLNDSHACEKSPEKELIEWYKNGIGELPKGFTWLCGHSIIKHSSGQEWYYNLWVNRGESKIYRLEEVK